MTRALVIVMLQVVIGSLAACAGPERSASGRVYVGRFDNDENRPPMLVNDSGPSTSPPVLIYGDGEH